MTKVTVLFVTCRLGGYDVLFDGLERQTFEDYELVVVDAWAPDRRDIVREIAERRGIPLARYVHPKERGLAHALNLGLAEARGDLVCPLNDYHWPPPDWLRRHWSVYETSGGRFTANGFAWHHAPPALKPAGLHVREYAVSLFQNPFRMETLDALPVTYKEELAWTKKFRWSLRDFGGGLFTSDGREYYNTLNNSIPREVLLRINGYDEEYDLSRAVLDIDAGLRAETIGHRFVLDTGSVVHTVDHGAIDAAFGDLWKDHYAFRRPHEDSLRYLDARLKEIEDVARAPNSFDLRKARP